VALALECVLAMRAEHGIRAQDVLRVEVETFRQALNIVGGGAAGDRATVASKEQADHSIPYLCAVALLDGDVWPPQFADDRVTRPDVQELMQSVWVRQRDDLTERYPNEMPCRVRILMRDGRELEGGRNDYRGFWRTRPLDWDGVMEKFERLSASVVEPAHAREIAQAVQDLDSIPLAELMQLLGRGALNQARSST